MSSTKKVGKFTSKSPSNLKHLIKHLTKSLFLLVQKEALNLMDMNFYNLFSHLM